MTFGIPLGLLQRLVPPRVTMPVVKTLKDLAPRLGRLILQSVVNATQDKQAENAAKRDEEDKKKNE